MWTIDSVLIEKNKDSEEKFSELLLGGWEPFTIYQGSMYFKKWIDA